MSVSPSRPPGLPIVIAFAGGIGSGKSAVSQWLEKHSHAIRWDADRAGHEALKRGEMKTALSDLWGEQIFDEHGEIDRGKLAALVFGPGREPARKQLESITHPCIRRDLEATLRQASEDKHCELLILDSPILLEAGWSEICDAFIFLDVPEEIRQARTLSRGWTSDELKRRELNQWPLEKKRAACQYVVENHGDLDETGSKITAILQPLLENARKTGGTK